LLNCYSLNPIGSTYYVLRKTYNLQLKTSPMHTFLLIPLCFALSIPVGRVSSENSAMGAWEIEKGNDRQVLLVRDNYFSITHFSIADKKFHHSFGGTINIVGGKATLVVEFDTRDRDAIGKKH